MFKHLTIDNFLNELKTKGSFLLPLRIFIGLGWSRAGIEKLTKTSWYNGEALQKFLVTHLDKGDIIFPPYEFLINNLFLPNVAILAWIIIIGQVLTGISILTGTFTNFGLMMGLIMNLNFILSGAPNPSAFYVVIQIVLFLSNTGAILGLDKALSKKIHYAFFIAQPEHKTIRPAAEKNFFLVLVFITLLSAIYSLFYIKDFSPTSHHDQAMILFILAMISSAAFFTKYYYLTQHRIKFLIVDDVSEAQEVMEDFINENYEIEIVKVNKISDAQIALLNDPNIVLIISDYNMPKSKENLDGGDLYIFNKNHKDLPFLLFSAEKIEDHDKLKNFYNENTHNHSIGKPFDKHVTKECIDNIIVYYMI
tara:strand:+ start:685 stop:1779 length:1095 start_codon:yes stop_codon:yes gene_type:complete